jgi:hypothetical protein
MGTWLRLRETTAATRLEYVQPSTFSVRERDPEPGPGLQSANRPANRGSLFGKMFQLKYGREQLTRRLPFCKFTMMLIMHSGAEGAR